MHDDHMYSRLLYSYGICKNDFISLVFQSRFVIILCYVSILGMGGKKCSKFNHVFHDASLDLF